MDQVVYASFVDVRNAINQDGTPVDPLKVKASAMFGVAYENVTAEQRRVAKSAAFGDLYSMRGTFHGLFKKRGL